MSTHRLHVLLALKPLDPSLQKRIFKLCFATKKETETVFSELCKKDKTWSVLGRRLAKFVHSDDLTMCIMLEALDVSYVKHCIQQLKMACVSTKSGAAVLAKPHMEWWPMEVMLVKPARFVLPRHITPRMRAKIERKEYRCSECCESFPWLFKEKKYTDQMMCIGCHDSVQEERKEKYRQQNIEYKAYCYRKRKGLREDWYIALFIFADGCCACLKLSNLKFLKLNSDSIQMA